MIHFELPGLPKMYNQYKNMHWAAKAQHVRDWKQRVYFKLVATKQIPAKPFNKAKVKLVRCSSAQCDFENLAQSMKPILDALVESGVIIDDNMSVIGRPEYEWQKVKPKGGKIIVSVWGEE